MDQTQATNTVASVAVAALDVPVLATATVLTTAFAAFRADEQFSFIRPYDPKVQSIPDYRHAVLRFRNTDNKVVKTAQMATVPQIKLPEDFILVMDKKAQQVFLGVLEDAEDDIIRNLHEGHKASKVSWSDLGMQKALDYLTAERVSKRLTKEQIENWFNIAGKQFCEQRAAQICEAKGIKDVETVAKQQAGTMNAYRKGMCALAAPVPNLGENEANALQNMLLVSKLDDDMAKVLKAKLHAILHPEVTENGDL